MKEHYRIITRTNPRLEQYELTRKNTEKGYKTFLKSNIDSGTGALFIAAEEHEIVGYILIMIKAEVPIYRHKKIGYVVDLYVRKSSRGRGISSQLKDAAIQWFKKKKLKFIALPVYPDNQSAHSIYKKWGFFDYKVEMRREI